MGRSFVIVYIFVTNIIVACAKIHGGPRGRFDKPIDQKTNYHNGISARHTHYSYHPPSRINFICRHCSSMSSYPVYHGIPPTYVYKYRESGSRFGVLLTGLALYNLGRASEYGHDMHYHTHRTDENCSLQVIDRAHFEETTFPCFMMSSFLQKADLQGPDTFDITSSNINIKSYVPTSGTPLEITREQTCVVWYNTTLNKEKTLIACALLKEYANTMKPSGVPVYVWLPLTIAIVVTISVSCQYCCRKKKVYKEETPLTENFTVGYSPSYN